MLLKPIFISYIVNPYSRTLLLFYPLTPLPPPDNETDPIGSYRKNSFAVNYSFICIFRRLSH